MLDPGLAALLAQQKVLVLDDDPFTLKMHVHVLRECGFTAVETFERAVVALESIKAGNVPDLILLDLSMPEMDGIEFLRHLATVSYAGGLILVSGEDERLLQSASRLVRAHGLRVVGYLSKPVRVTDLHAIVETSRRPSPSKRINSSKSYSVEDVKRAIRRREIFNFYQPKIALRSNDLTGMEALARWHHPEDGVVGPGRFIPIAEESGLAEELTRLVFSTAMLDTRALKEQGLTVEVAINLAPAALESLDLVDYLASETQNAGLPPQSVILELTESQIMGDLRDSLDILTRLRLKRFKLSIDDFGTGYSSLSQLRDLPFDELKIDQLFVHNASRDATARAIYETSLDLAQKLGMKSVAEGVESEDDLQFVRSTTCDTAQGFLMARPMDPDALVGWARDWRLKTATSTAGADS